MESAGLKVMGSPIDFILGATESEHVCDQAFFTWVNADS